MSKYMILVIVSTCAFICKIPFVRLFLLDRIFIGYLYLNFYSITILEEGSISSVCEFGSVMMLQQFCVLTIIDNISRASK